MRLNKISILCILVTTLIVVGCKKSVVEEEKVVKNGVWNRFETLDWNFYVTNAEECYDLWGIAEIDTTKLRDKELPLIVELTSEAGEHRQWRAYMAVRDNSGKTTGKPSGTNKVLCQTKLRGYFFFNGKGTYSLKLKQGTSRYDIAGVERVKLKIEQSKLEYPK